MTQYFRQVTEHPAFEKVVIAFILFAAIVVGLETSRPLMAEYGSLLHLLDKIILWAFVIEALLKIGAEFPRPWKYFSSGWNLFDFTIVVVCFLPVDAEFVAVLRLARILRILRLVTVIPKLQALVLGVIKSLPSLFYVSVLMSILFYMYAVMGIFFFRDNDPGHFGDLSKALTTLFRVVTLEDWTDVMYTAYYGSDVYHAQGPVPVGPEPQAFGYWGVAYFASFVIFGAMVMINLFIGVVLTSLTEAQADQLRAKLHLEDGENADNHQLISRSLSNIEKELSDIRNRLPR